MIPIFFFNTLLIFFGLIAPGLRILNLFVKSITVDSIPIFGDLSSIINFIFLPNSSKTSLALTGLMPDERFALGIASGNCIFFSIVRIILFLGNRIATVSKFAVTFEFIFEVLFNQKNLLCYLY